MNPASEQPVDVILNDRFCLSCGESLHGEPISREPHYNMLITHCRRCNHVAPVQETSRLSRTAQRWGGAGPGFLDVDDGRVVGRRINGDVRYNPGGYG